MSTPAAKDPSAFPLAGGSGAGSGSSGAAASTGQWRGHEGTDTPGRGWQAQPVSRAHGPARLCRRRPGRAAATGLRRAPTRAAARVDKPILASSQGGGCRQYDLVVTAEEDTVAGALRGALAETLVKPSDQDQDPASQRSRLPVAGRQAPHASSMAVVSARPCSGSRSPPGGSPRNSVIFRPPR
jgi:hypothetical protein